MDEGWTRWVLEEFEFAYTQPSLNGQIQHASSRERFDTIVFPDQSDSSILEGYREGTMAAGVHGRESRPRHCDS